MILLDTSGVLAAVDPRQVQHAAAARVLLRRPRRILSPFVLAELDSLIASNGGQAAELTLLADVGRGAYELEAFGAEDVDAAIGVIKRCADLGLGLADASSVGAVLMDQDMVPGDHSARRAKGRFAARRRGHTRQEG